MVEGSEIFPTGCHSQIMQLGGGVGLTVLANSGCYLVRVKTWNIVVDGLDLLQQSLSGVEFTKYLRGMEEGNEPFCQHRPSQ